MVMVNISNGVKRPIRIAENIGISGKPYKKLSGDVARGSHRYHP